MTRRRLDFGSFSLDVECAALMHAGAAPAAIGMRAAALLRCLLQAEGRIVAKSDLIDAAWPGAVVDDSNLSVQVAALRKALAREPGAEKWIVTVPRVGYRFVGPRAHAAAPVANSEPAAVAAEHRPSIAVLPFAYLGGLDGDRGQQYLADAVTEETITALTRFRWFHVLGRSASFWIGGDAQHLQERVRELDVDYLLEGSLQREAGRVRIAARLVEARSGRQLWTERFDSDAADAFAIQDRIATAVAAAAEPELLKSESAVATRRRRVGNESALDMVYQGMLLFHRIGQETHWRARELFRRALAVDPTLPEAHAWLARVSAGIVAYGWSASADDDLAEGIAAAETAIRLDERNPYAHYALAITSVYRHSFEQAMAASRAAIELNPSFALGWLVLGMAELFAAHGDSGTAALARGLTLNPHDPQNFVWLALAATARLLHDDPTQAERLAERTLALRPGWCGALELLACCRAAMNDVGGARARLARITDHDRPLAGLLRPLLETQPASRRRIETLLSRARTGRLLVT